MPTTRTRRSRKSKAPITPELVAKFGRWKELRSRRGSASTPEGILLSESEESEYQAISSEINRAYHGPLRRPWDGATPLLYKAFPDEWPESEPGSGDTWEEALKYRRQLEAELASLNGN